MKNTAEQKEAYKELVGSAYDVGFAHGLADHSLSEMMMSCERAVGRTLPVSVWLDLFAGREAGLAERKDAAAPDPYPTELIDWTDVPL